MDFSKKINVVYNITPKEFRDNYFKPQRPVIIKELFKNQIAGREWSIANFKSTMGDVLVDVFDNKKNKDASAITEPDLQMKFRDFLDIISKDEPTDLRMFLFNLFEHKPSLKREFKCPEIFKGILGRVSYVFFGGKNTKVRIHYDIDMSNVLLTQFEGRKKVLLIAPEYSKLLYRLPFNTYSLVDLDKPNYEKYPGLKYVEGYECILEHGDSLFMPSGYWHYMTYLEGGFAANYRKIAPLLKTKLEGILNLAVFMPFDKIMTKVLRDGWLEIKQYVAEQRANEEIKKIISNQRSVNLLPVYRSKDFNMFS